MNFKLLLIFSFLTIAALAQQPLTQRPGDLQNVIPPSPNASSLGKYADFPVSLYTGIPEIDIPLYTLKGRSMSVPVSVSYHASGIRVGEVASSVGLGWALNGGGVITRSVRGLPDEAGGSGYTTIKSYYNNPGDLSSGTLTGAAVPDSMNVVNASAGASDSEPDLYMFNALGRSFKFYFAGNNAVVTQPSSGMIIKSFLIQNNTWLVTMEDGTKLVFGGASAIEYTASSRAVVEASAPNFVSAWYLKTMTSPTGEVINFTYEKSTINQDATFYQVDYRLLFSQKSGCATTNPPKPAYKYFETQVDTMLNLKSIESDLAKVVFLNDTTGRIDLKGGKYLKEIDVYAKPTSKLIHKFTFTHSYSTAANGNSYTTPNSTQAKYRMKLNSVQEVPVNGSSPKVWSFGYNPLTLPSRQSYAQDHWGYYNGATNNTTLLPSVPGFDNPAKYTSGIRDGDSLSMSAEMLTKITYPTGGFTKFNYEPNSIPTTKDYQTAQAASINMYLTANQNPFNNTLTQTLTLTQPQYTGFTINASFSTSIINDYGPTTIIATVSILNSSQAIVTNFNISGNKLSSGHYTVSKNIYLNAGTYTFKVHSISQATDFTYNTDFVSIQGNINYTGSLGVHPFNQPVGGVRIKTMIDSSGNSTPVQRNFKYENANVVPFDPVNDYISVISDNTYDDNGTCSTGPSGSPSENTTPPDTSQQDTNYPPTAPYQFPGSYNVGFPSTGGSGTTCVDYTTTNYNFDLSTLGISSYSCASQTYVKPPSKKNTYYVYNTIIGPARGGPNIAADSLDVTNDNAAQTGIPGMLISSYQYAARNSSVRCALGSIQGGTVGYGKVTVTYGPTGGNGYTVSYFSQASDLNVPSSKVMPYPPIVPLDWQKGLLLNEITYSNSNIAVKRTCNTYAFVNQQSIKTFKAAPLFNTPSTHYPASLLSQFINKVYYQIISQQVQKVTSGSINYYNNAADSVVTLTNYYYDNPADYQPVRTETLNSRGENLKMLSRTALEKADINTSITLTPAASAAIDTMVARNMISHPIEVETYNNNVLVSKALTNYNLYSSNVLPNEVKTVEGANAIQSRVLFNSYNNKGGLLEQQKTAGPLNDYLWDYASSYVIASVTGASRTNIAYTSFEADSTGNWTVPTAARDTVTAALTGYKSYALAGNSISKSGLSTGTTYVVSYWTRNTSAYIITGTVSGYPVKGVTVNGWTYYEHLVTGQSTISVTGTGSIDELRLYPLGALMTTYTYSPQVGVTSTTDAKGQTTYYEYDSFQRLMNIRDLNGNIIKHTDYHYQGQ